LQEGHARAEADVIELSEDAYDPVVYCEDLFEGLGAVHFESVPESVPDKIQAQDGLPITMPVERVVQKGRSVEAGSQAIRFVAPQRLWC